MPTQLAGVNWTNGYASNNVTVTVTADAEDNREISLGANQMDFLVNIPIDFSELKLLYISSDQDVTIETNSGSAPDDTLTIKAGKPLLWYTGCGLTNPLTVDVTKFYLTNTTALTLKVYVLQDSTP